MVPLQVRKDLDVHPETFRRLISDLNEFELISARLIPPKRPMPRRGAMSFHRPIGIELTERGSRVLEVAREVRKTVIRHARLLPKSSVERWRSQLFPRPLDKGR